MKIYSKLYVFKQKWKNFSKYLIIIILFTFFCYRKINHFRQKRFLCCERILSKDILLILLSFATSETRWSDCLTNIWPFITMKVCPIECKICQKSSKCCQIQNELFQRSFLSLPSVEISPNLVTLLATFA